MTSSVASITLISKPIWRSLGSRNASLNIRKYRPLCSAPPYRFQRCGKCQFAFRQQSLPDAQTDNECLSADIFASIVSSPSAPRRSHDFPRQANVRHTPIRNDDSIFASDRRQVCVRAGWYQSSRRRQSLPPPKRSRHFQRIRTSGSATRVSCANKR
jgi:hypothetical protein